MEIVAKVWSRAVCEAPATGTKATGSPSRHHGRMPGLAAPDYQVARFLIERGLAAIYLVAFVVAWRQFPALCGERGLEPAPHLLALLRRFLDAPTLFRWVRYSDAKLRLVSAIASVIA